MPAARQRPLEDSRSETSSTIATLKDRSALAHTTTMLTTTVKSRKPHNIPAISLGAASKVLVNGGGTTVGAAVVPELDPNLPKIDWLTFSPQTLHAYRQAYRLDTPSVHTHPHADLIYKSSRVAKRSPSVVYARRKSREEKHERRRAAQLVQQNFKDKGKRRSDEKQQQQEKSPDMMVSSELELQSHLQGQDLGDGTNDRHESLVDTKPHPAVPHQPLPLLATTVRKHFNSLSLNESDILTRFLYVVHHSPSSSSSPRTGPLSSSQQPQPQRHPSLTATTFPPSSHQQQHQLGREAVLGISGTEGQGKTMGSQGRECPRNDGAAVGGDLGFRLRFRP